MGISIFPSTAAEFVSNNFVIDMNNTTNNTADTNGVKQAGPYSMSFSSGDTSFDVYFIDADGNSVGYSNTTSITASGTFDTVVILGVASDEIITFTYSGSVNNADGQGDEPGAGAYLTSITPADLPSIDDTATVVGGNFGTATEFTFESGTVVLPAKNAAIVSGTEALVTRPDGLIQDDAPYDFKAVNPGVTPPSSVDYILAGTVTAGADPTWVTTSPLNAAAPNAAFSQTLEATDSDGTVDNYAVTAGTITAGLSLDSSTGVLAGTPTTTGTYTFTVRATDSGGNVADREFTQEVAIATGGTVSSDGTYTYHTFLSSDTLTLNVQKDIEYLVIAGGGGGGGSSNFFSGNSGGGGAGGLLSGTATALASGSYTITVGAGGGGGSSPSATNGGDGSDSLFDTVSGTAIGGGGGGTSPSGASGRSGGSGGGGGAPSGSGGSGTAGQGNNGGNAGSQGGGGGGAGGAGGEQNPGAGLTFQEYADATGIGTGVFAEGGSGSSGASTPVAGTGFGGNGRTQNNNGSPGSDGGVIVRYIP